MTTLVRLWTKGTLCRRKLDSKFFYSPRVAIGDWQQQAAREATARFLATPNTPLETLLSCLHEAVARNSGTNLQMSYPHEGTLNK